MSTLAAEWGVGQVFWSILWFTLFFFWIWTVVIVFMDIFRSDDLSGWGKAIWTIFVIFLPFLGVFVYLIARGKQMQQHAVDAAQQRDDHFRSYVQDVTAAPSPAAEVAQLADLRDRGLLDEAEFQKAKAKALS